MSTQIKTMPQVGDKAPAFEVETHKGLVRFPEYCEGRWCIFFAHPANFTSAWRMYSTFLLLKERWFDERNTKLLALTNEPMRFNTWSDKVRRYIEIFLKAPVIQDPDFLLANRYGMASGRRKLPGYDRLAFIIDPTGIIRLILHNPLPSIEHAVLALERELDRLQRNGEPDKPELPPLTLQEILEKSDRLPKYKPKPAYFKKDKIIQN